LKICEVQISAQLEVHRAVTVQESELPGSRLWTVWVGSFSLIRQYHCRQILNLVARAHVCRRLQRGVMSSLLVLWTM
jgi:hypothetical protein